MVARSSAVASQLPVCVLSNTDVVKYSSWELLQLMSLNVAIKLEPKTKAPEENGLDKRNILAER